MSKRLPASERNPNRRGAFALRLSTGRIIRFKDAFHRGAACQDLSFQRFAHAGEMTAFALSLPNGYETFREANADRS